MADETLVVTSKIKRYIKDKSDMNTAGAVAEVLSDRIREMLDAAIESARKDGRKTVKDRDVPDLPGSGGGGAGGEVGESNVGGLGGPGI